MDMKDVLMEYQAPSMTGLMKILDILTPRYSIDNEADKLLDDMDMYEITGYSKEDVIPYLKQGFQRFKKLVVYSKIADNADVLTSLAGMYFETTGLLAGFAPSIPANLIEEGIEFLFKIPFYCNVISDPELKDSFPIIRTEIFSSAIPVIGDIQDLRPVYVNRAFNIIRDYALHHILLSREEQVNTGYQAGYQAGLEAAREMQK